MRPFCLLLVSSPPFYLFRAFYRVSDGIILNDIRPSGSVEEQVFYISPHPGYINFTIINIIVWSSD